MIVTIDSLDHQGRGIAHMDEKVIFVFDALIGETVEIKVLKKKKNIIEAIKIKILKASEQRKESPCPYFGKCGGCDLLHMSDQEQLEYKQKKVSEIMKKFAGIDGVVRPIVKNKNVFGYRNKVVFQVDQKVGFYQKKSNKIIEIKECLLLSRKMNEILFLIQHYMNLDYVNQVMIRYSETLKNCMVVFDVSKNFSDFQIPFEQLEGISILKKKNNLYEVLVGNSFILEHIGTYEFKISPDSFFQVNTKQMEKLYQVVLECSELTGKENVLDLYCGTGTIGIFLSSKAKEVLGIEMNESAVQDAIWNKKRNHIKNIEFLCGDVGDILEKTLFDPHVVIVDPPRMGLDEKAIRNLKRIHAPKIVYVSCDPVTLARDIKKLSDHYETTTIIPVDMFSNTYHVECVCVLEI